MSEALFSALEVDVSPDAKPGYRLDRLEVFNWGTFDGRVHRLHLGGDNTLLTGDIGSGKSTLVDAVTTLLLPAHKINYNKAAGADTRERSLRSYVLGHYKSEGVESTGASRPVGLRDHRHYAVILGVFANAGHDARVTLAQVFWTRDTSQQPQRFFVVAETDLTIAEAFSDFGADIGGLKRRLRASGAHVSDHFPDYGTRARRALGIQSLQALELLHQTISMKSVGNLTDFVRSHMLEGADIGARIDSLVGHFEDLTRAHDSVRRAKDQLAQLDPLLVEGERHDRLGDAMSSDRLRQEALPVWAAEHKAALLRSELEEVRSEVTAVGLEQEEADALLTELSSTRDRLLRERDGAGGARIAELDHLITTRADQRDARRSRARRHAELLLDAGLPAVEDAASFARANAMADEQRTGLAEDQEATANRTTEVAVEQHQVRTESDQISAYLRTLDGRQSNIDASNLRIRTALAHALQMAEDALPFVGELVQVRPEHAPWQGAAERVLRGFALSVLVPADRHDEASRWIDANHLGGRLVFYRVSSRLAHSSPPLRDEQLLADLLDIKPGPFAEWIARELGHRADHVCVDSVDALGQHVKAVTRNGLVKAGSARGEKDDRYRVDDRTRWVLGWSNTEKVDALLAQGQHVQRRLTELAGEIETLTRHRDTLSGQKSCLDRLNEYLTWSDLDWRSSAAAVARHEAERRELVSGNEQLSAIARRLGQTVEELTAARALLDTLTSRRGELKERAASLGAGLAAAEAVTTSREEAALARLHTAYEALDREVGHPTSVGDCESRERAHRELLTQRLAKSGDEQKKVGERIIGLMGSFRRAWPAETVDMDASLAALGEFRELRDQIATDDLPRFESEFKRQLNANTINDIAGFHGWLERSSTQIKERIGEINESLRAIEYNPDRHIQLIHAPTLNQEVKAFREDLRACTDDALVDDDQYSEDRFLRVKGILERFRGREGNADIDRRWTSLVTDVRNWYVFAASERWRESGEEWEHYTDSDGKSGGQKEKLAYTILAASLAYQFKLQWGVAVSRDFRFAVIDEAFGRGSDASTRYALQLFAKLGLQLLIVTPLQKVHVIEPYVRAVGFVDNPTGELSRLQTLTIEDFRARRETHVATTTVGMVVTEVTEDATS